MAETPREADKANATATGASASGLSTATNVNRIVATPADSLVGARQMGTISKMAAPLAAGSKPQLGEPERRMAWLMFLRTLVVSSVLGLSLWLSMAQSPTRASVWLLSGIIVTTYLQNVLFGLLLRGSCRRRGWRCGSSAATWC